MIVRSEFTVAQWNQSDLEPAIAGMLISRASVIFESTGEIDGKFNVEYVIHSFAPDDADLHNSTATYVGYMVFTGSIDGKTGSFVLEDKGAYANSVPASDLVIKSNTGTNDFQGIRGIGKYYADDGKMVIQIDCSFSQ
ncbi:MAG: DUF3224 domain-containing protein [Oscillospiraceae bacterium]|jgi:hypothetical protein|nr:DUF3224 domain-containing protein [Oscillospiraceae bacterium]